MMIELDENGATLCGKYQLVPVADIDGDKVLLDALAVIDAGRARRTARLLAEQSLTFDRRAGATIAAPPQELEKE